MFPITLPPCFDVIFLPLLYLVTDTSPVPMATPSRPLQVYTCRLRTDIGSLADSSPMAPSSTTSVLSYPVDLPIAIRKGTHSSHNPHHIYNFMTYHHLSFPYFFFVSTLSFVYVPQTVHEALSHQDWKQAMVEEMIALHSSGSWDLVTLPPGKTLVGCPWVYIVKVGPDG